MRGIQLLHSHLRGKGVYQNANVCEQGAETEEVQSARLHINFYN